MKQTSWNGVFFKYFIMLIVRHVYVDAGSCRLSKATKVSEYTTSADVMGWSAGIELA